MAITDPDQIVISQDRIYQHATLQVNYTTYDLQREQDVIHVGTSKTGIMAYTPPPPGSDPSDATPWSYATVLGIYHCNISVRAGDRAISRRVDFVWVRWFDTDDVDFGTQVSRLERVSYAPFMSDIGQWSDAFGFIDPATIIRGCHFIPVFHSGRTTTLLPPSMVRSVEGDWRHFYVNRYVLRPSVRTLL